MGYLRPFRGQAARERTGTGLAANTLPRHARLGMPEPAPTGDRTYSRADLWTGSRSRGRSRSRTLLADRRDTPEAATPCMLVRARALACAENHSQRTEKQEAADGRTNMCAHVTARRPGMTVCAQHFGQAGKRVCELSASAATVQMPCEFRLLEF